ncbi:membrane protein DedA, SNARE-associated domain [Actinomadura mexicana]|uniref:Membrane protein DedA, SNARE-associated domain n=2 Tax=Actinomadura mexicana TaxID=134959 RepID=A0A238ZBA3_9ACTN|nr:membrane protein DedA, SNARE-associated domain [Actinomadura mexicana]
MGVVDTAVTSPWFYLVLFAVAAVDGFFPVVPSESMVITAGVYAASGQPELVPVVVLAAAGAFLGDHVSYLVGRRAGGRLVRGARPGTRRHAVLGWARGAMAERGGMILVVARYVPGGRTAVTLTMGAVKYRLRSFSLFAAVAAVSWALYGALLGYVGGRAFEDDPLKGVVVGLGLALGVTGVVEVVRFVRRRGAVDAGPERSERGPGERSPVVRVGPMPGE